MSTKEQERFAAMARERCECGHPRDAHGIWRVSPSESCRATVYETVPSGMNAWPCPCKRFVGTGGEA